MTADSTKSVSKRTSEPQAAANSPATFPSTQSPKIKYWEVQGESSVKYIELLLGSESLSLAKIEESVAHLDHAVFADFHRGISFSQLFESRAFEALAHAVYLSKRQGFSEWRDLLVNIIHLFPSSEIILYYTTTVFTMERRIWLCKVLPAVWNVLNDGGSTVDTIIKALK